MADRHHKFVFTNDRARELIEWRKRAGMTQRQASEALGIKGQNTVSRWENMTRRPSREDFDRAMLLYRSKFAERHNADVPRGTSGVREQVAPYAASDGLFDPELVVNRPRVAGWLLRLQADLVELGATTHQAQGAADLLAQIPRSNASEGRTDWTEQDAIDAMAEEAKEFRATFEKLKRGQGQ